MGMTDRIETFILELLKQEREDWLTIQRNELADIFGCVPSQINYVISTRFSPERGYTVVSRRGGGGCVRIRHTEKKQGLSAADAEGEIDRLCKSGAVSGREAALMRAALTDTALGGAEGADALRASVLNGMKKAIGVI